jgi:hypothetical protein
MWFGANPASLVRRSAGDIADPLIVNWPHAGHHLPY